MGKVPERLHLSRLSNDDKRFPIVVGSTLFCCQKAMKWTLEESIAGWVMHEFISDIWNKTFVRVLCFVKITPYRKQSRSKTWTLLLFSSRDGFFTVGLSRTRRPPRKRQNMGTVHKINMDSTEVENYSRNGMTPSSIPITPQHHDLERLLFFASEYDSSRPWRWRGQHTNLLRPFLFRS